MPLAHGRIPVILSRKWRTCQQFSKSVGEARHPGITKYSAVAESEPAESTGKAGVNVVQNYTAGSRW